MSLQFNTHLIPTGDNNYNIKPIKNYIQSNFWVVRRKVMVGQSKIISSNPTKFYKSFSITAFFGNYYHI